VIRAAVEQRKWPRYHRAGEEGKWENQKEKLRQTRAKGPAA
jgi:hypothetical protein